MKDLLLNEVLWVYDVCEARWRKIGEQRVGLNCGC